MAESDNEGKVKVIDRRRFTADGDLRAPAGVPAAADAAGIETPAPAAAADPAPPPAPHPAQQDVEPASAQTSEMPEAAADEAGPAGDPGALPPGPGISDVVDLLAQQAMAFLSGQVPGRGRDPVTARYFIDLLGVLKTKTAGRLTLEETNFLDDVLYQLRSLFVAATR